MPNESILYRTYSDAYLDYWGKVFLANPGLRQRSVLFETFLIAPQECLAAIMRPVPTVDSHAPLLPHQRRARAKVEGLSHLRKIVAGHYGRAN